MYQLNVHYADMKTCNCQTKQVENIDYNFVCFFGQVPTQLLTSRSKAVRGRGLLEVANLISIQR